MHSILYPLRGPTHATKETDRRSNVAVLCYKATLARLQYLLLWMYIETTNMELPGCLGYSRVVRAASWSSKMQWLQLMGGIMHGALLQWVQQPLHKLAFFGEQGWCCCHGWKRSDQQDRDWPGPTWHSQSSMASAHVKTCTQTIYFSRHKF